MVDKYRLIKIETFSDDAQLSVKYQIQRKTLFGYVRCLIPVLKHGVVMGNSIDYKYVKFDSIDVAKECLNNLQNPYVYHYKGYKITKIFYDNTQSFRYYIECKQTFEEFIFGEKNIQFSDKLEILKKIIDSKIIKTKTTIL